MADKKLSDVNPALRVLVIAPIAFALACGVALALTMVLGPFGMAIGAIAIVVAPLAVLFPGMTMSKDERSASTVKKEIRDKMPDGVTHLTRKGDGGWQFWKVRKNKVYRWDTGPLLWAKTDVKADQFKDAQNVMSLKDATDFGFMK